mgnify:CR=1 FL=1
MAGVGADVELTCAGVSKVVGLHAIFGVVFVNVSYPVGIAVDKTDIKWESRATKVFFCPQRCVAIQYKIEIYGQSMLRGSPPAKNLVQILHHLFFVFLFFNLVSNNTFFDNSQDPRSRHISRQRKWRASFCPEVATKIHSPPWRASPGLGLPFFEPTYGVLLVLALSNHDPDGRKQEQFFNMLMVFERILSRNIPSKGVCCQIKLCEFSILSGAQKL